MMSRFFSKTTVRPRWTATIAVVLGVFMVASPGVARAQLGCAIDSECDDTNICTDDACVAGICEHVNNTAPCDDGLYCTQTDTCSGGFCAGAGDPCLAQGQVCDATRSMCVDKLATITAHNLYMYSGTTADLIVSGQIAGYEAYSVFSTLAILPQSYWGLAGTGSVGFTPAPPTDIVQLGDPWPGGSVFESYDTDAWAGGDNTMNYAVIYDASVYDPSYVPGSPLFSGPLMRFPVTASNDAHGAWLVWQLMSDWYPMGISALPFDGVITVFPETCMTDLDCDDGVFCNGAETCAAGRCQPGAPIVCDDGIPCTLDMCSYLYGDTCIHMPMYQRCDNGIFCDGVETCDAVLDCVPGTDPCPGQLCDEAIPACVECLTNADCDDGLFCNGAEICTAGVCMLGSDPCPGQTCDEAAATCFTALIGEGFILSRNADFSTDDRNFFRNETIHMLMWSDQVDFSNISRERWELKDASKNKVRQPLTNHFDGTWTASYLLSDLPGMATDWMWKGEVKDNSGTRYKPANSITVLDAPACSIDLDCDDGDACTTDVCSGGSCSNTPINCGDGDVCTTDSCSGGTCFNDPVICDDGNACTIDSCDPIAGCTNTPINCDDGDVCTTDSCSGGTCFNDPVTCDDGNACTIDSCDPTAGCTNTPINCDDGNSCTTDSCSGGVCLNNPVVPCCGDGFCDAGEYSCSCAADCGPAPASEVNCTDGIDEDCDGLTDCADLDCSGDPACAVPVGEGYILSLNADFSTDDRVYTRGDTLYVIIWTDQVDFNGISRERWELKDSSKNKVRQPLTNHFDGTWTAAYNVSGLPSGATDWTWKGEVKDSTGTRYKPRDIITVLP